MAELCSESSGSQRGTALQPVLKEPWAPGLGTRTGTGLGVIAPRLPPQSREVGAHFPEALKPESLESSVGEGGRDCSSTSCCLVAVISHLLNIYTFFLSPHHGHSICAQAVRNSSEGNTLPAASSHFPSAVILSPLLHLPAVGQCLGTETRPSARIKLPGVGRGSVGGQETLFSHPETPSSHGSWKVCRPVSAGVKS